MYLHGSVLVYGQLAVVHLLELTAAGLHLYCWVHCLLSLAVGYRCGSLMHVHLMPCQRGPAAPHTTSHRGQREH